MQRKVRGVPFETTSMPTLSSSSSTLSIPLFRNQFTPTIISSLSGPAVTINKVSSHLSLGPFDQTSSAPDIQGFSSVGIIIQPCELPLQTSQCPRTNALICAKTTISTSVDLLALGYCDPLRQSCQPPSWISNHPHGITKRTGSFLAMTVLSTPPRTMEPYLHLLSVL